MNFPTPKKSTEGSNMKILITGGAGYVGSHIVLEVIRAGH